MAVRTPSKAPIFELYSINELAVAMGVSEVYVAMIKSGQSPLSSKFRYTAVAKLGRTEEDLFGPVQED